MTSIHLYTSITEGLLSITSQYKNGKVNKSTFNKYIMNNLSFLLNTLNDKSNLNPNTNESKHSNNSTSTSFSNPLLDIVLPMSQISYSTETRLNSNEINFLPLSENTNHSTAISANNECLFEIQFEQTPIHSLSTDSKNELDSINILDFDNDDIFDLYFTSSSQTDRNKTSNNDSINLLSGDLGEINLNISGKKIESSSFIHSALSTDKDIQENKDIQEINDLGSLSREISRSYSSLKSFFQMSKFTVVSKNNSNDNKAKTKALLECALKEFSLELPKNTIKTYITDMNITYLRLMKEHFTKLKEESMFALDFENKLLLNHFKQFIFEIGISTKKIYDLTLRNFIYANNNFSFNDFLSCFSQLLKAKDVYCFTKYKFLLYITRTNNENELTARHFKRFLSLIRCKKIYDKDIYDNIASKFLTKYQLIYPGKNLTKISVENAIIVLESFFEDSN